ncbi:MAG: flagellar motor switch protein FliM [Gammaproteobacteria bacterium]
MGDEAQDAAPEEVTGEAEEASEDNDAVLSDAEVGALLEGVAEGAVATGGGLGQSQDIREFSFSDNAHVSSYCPAPLVNLYERLSRRIQAQLYDMLREDMTVELESLRRHRYDDYLASVNEPASVNVIVEPTLPGAGMIVLDATLIGALVDCYYGGGTQSEPVSDAPTEPRALTPVEMRMAGKCVDLVLHHLNDIWAPVTALKFEPKESETTPKLVTVAGASELMLVAQFTLGLGTTTGECHLVMPLGMIAPMRAALAASGQGKLARRSGFVAQMRDHLHNVDVELVGTLCEFEMSLRQVVAMAPGEVIPIDLPPNAVLRIDNSDVLFGRFGRSRGINAVAIEYRDTQLSTPNEERR